MKANYSNGTRVIIYNLGDGREYLGTICGKSIENVWDIYIVKLDDPNAFLNNQWDCITLPEAYLRAEEIIDYSEVYEDSSGNKYYFDRKKYYHNLNDSAIDSFNGDKYYFIHSTHYMSFSKSKNELTINLGLIKIDSKYYNYIQQNIANINKTFSPEIKISKFLSEKKIWNELPDFIKNLIII